MFISLHRQTYIYVTINQEKEAVILRMGCHGRSLRTSSWAELEGRKGEEESNVILFELKAFKKKNKLPNVTIMPGSTLTFMLLIASCMKSRAYF